MKSTLTRKAVLIVLGVFVATALVQLIAAALATRNLGPAWIDAWVRWDAGWYRQMALDGYWYKPGEQSPVAFFPAYPMSIRALRWVTGLDPNVAGVVISAVCGPLALLLFFRWARRLADEAQAFAATALFAVYPFAYFLYGTMYSDGLFLAMVIPAFLFLERRQIVWATIFGVLATTCRPVAPAVVLGLVIRNLELRRQEGEPVRVLDFVPALAGLGMAGYMGFLWWQFGEPLAFAKVQSAVGWDHVPGWRTWFKVTWFKTMFPTVDPGVGFRLGLHAALTVGALALVWPMRRRLGWGYTVYSFVAVGIPALSIKDFHGMGRYAMAAFPCVLVLSQVICERVWLRRAVLASSVGMLVWFATRFARGEFTA